MGDTERNWIAFHDEKVRELEHQYELGQLEWQKEKSKVSPYVVFFCVSELRFLKAADIRSRQN